MAGSVREPIQVYLTPDERRALDDAARKLGVSRSEVLRRGLRAVGAASPSHAAEALSVEGALTPPKAGPGAPPPSRPIARLGELLDELSGDREDR